MCDKEFIWNPSNCECECDKSCDIGEYLDYKYCECRKRIIECSKDIYENETRVVIPLNATPLNTTPLKVYKNVCNSCMIYVVLFVVFLIASICIYCVFIYFYWYLKKR